MVNWGPKDSDMAGTQAAMIRAARSALIEAKIHGVSVAQWIDGKVVWIPPEDIEIPTLPENARKPSRSRER